MKSFASRPSLCVSLFLVAVTSHYPSFAVASLHPESGRGTATGRPDAAFLETRVIPAGGNLSAAPAGRQISPDSAASSNQPTPDSASEPVPNPAEWGPWPVGVVTVRFYDASRDRTLVTDIWYPSQAVANPGTFYLHAVWGIAERDATPDPSGGPYPMVVFSHGDFGTRDQSPFYTEHLASQGFIVVAPDHEGDTFHGYSSTASADSIIDRPLDISFIIDNMLEMSLGGEFPVAGSIDPDRIGMSGHSYGAYTTLMICGARLRVDSARESCAQGSAYNCEVARYAESMFGAGVNWLDLSDPRVDACVPQAPGPWDYFQAEGLSSIDRPMGYVAGEIDKTFPYETEAMPIYQATPGPKYLMSLLNRGHLAFTFVYDARPASGRRCDSYAQCPNRDPDHDEINAFGVAFFSYYLKDETDYASYLSTDYYEINYPGRATCESEP